MDMEFPKLLAKAVLKGTNICFHDRDVTDEALTEYMDWKSTLGLKMVRPSTLAKFHARGLWTREIWEVFKNSNRINSLKDKRPSKMRQKYN